MGQSLAATNGDENEYIAKLKSGQLKPSLEMNIFKAPAPPQSNLDLTGKYLWKRDKVVEILTLKSDGSVIFNLEDNGKWEN